MAKREKQRIRIKLRGFDHRGVDGAAFDIVETAKRSGATVSGPVPLPTKIERFSINSSPFVNKKAMDQWETRTHERVVDILDPTADTVEHLRKLNLPAGVEITITL